MTTLKALRLLHQQSLDAIASEVGIRKGSLSVIERYPQRAGKRLRKRIAAHYKTPWDQLAHELSGPAIAAALLSRLKEVYAAKAAPKLKH